MLNSTALHQPIEKEHESGVDRLKRCDYFLELPLVLLQFILLFVVGW